jgi:hypothetical protein
MKIWIKDLNNKAQIYMEDTTTWQNSNGHVFDSRWQL